MADRKVCEDSGVYKLVIAGTLPSLNELIDAERTHRHKGATLKRNSELLIRRMIKHQLRETKPKTPVVLHYHFFEPSRRRDKDNIAAFAHKVVQDSLVQEGVLENDGWDFVAGFTDSFGIDKKCPRIEIVIEEYLHGEEEKTW